MILGLDVGERRIGVAITDPGESFSLPLRTIDRTDSLHDDLETILAIVREYGATAIVVGDPVSLSGGAIERVDERMTTAQVTRTLVDADVSRKKRKRVVDQLAAALILDSYLARRRR